MLFRNRTEAGWYLASKLSKYVDDPHVLVLALPRGGVPVAFEVAQALNAPLDVFLVRKLGVPGQEEVAMGAIATGGVRVLNRDIINNLRISEEDIKYVTGIERQELQRRERIYRGTRPEPTVKDRTVILVDDGLATGASMHAAVSALRRLQPGRIVVAVPVGAHETCEAFSSEADETICAREPVPFFAVGQWYGDFSPTTDQEVRELLLRAARTYEAAQPWHEPVSA